MKKAETFRSPPFGFPLRLGRRAALERDVDAAVLRFAHAVGGRDHRVAFAFARDRDRAARDAFRNQRAFHDAAVGTKPAGWVDIQDNVMGRASQDGLRQNVCCR